MTSAGKSTILVVDDDKSSLFALSDILRPMYTVLAAKDGTSAV